MAAREFKINEVIEFRIRCNGDPAIDNPIVIVYDEADTIESTLTLGSGLTQVGSTKIVEGNFTPDAQGEWMLLATDDKGLEVIKHYSVGQYNLPAIGAKLVTVETKIDTLTTQLATHNTDIINALNAMVAALSGGGGHFG